MTVAEPDWDLGRWVRILDRIEHRQPGVGLRFWGPPLWLEVTMVGPDSDLWPVVADESRSWDWQSNGPCTSLAATHDADDDELLAMAGRYTIENLVLNAVHEIGEWLRLDGRRLFPAHRSGRESGGGADGQGNGAVTVRVDFARANAPVVLARELVRADLARRVSAAVAPSRFTYLPGITIGYEPSGPAVLVHGNGRARTAWCSTWSATTLTADDDELPASVARDVHRSLVAYEADRICRAFHIDGCRPWSMTDAPVATRLSIAIEYADA